jgi:hypothetical protein
VAHEAVRDHLSTLLESECFRSSRRCKEFLSFVVEHTLDGQVERLKERNIGAEVFNRPEYDPTTDTLVRVTANELRKRLHQYYQNASDLPLRIELPTGCYVPEFRTQEELQPAPPVTAEGGTISPDRVPSRSSQGMQLRRLAPWIVLGVAIGVAVLIWLRFPLQPRPLDRFWAPVLTKSDPLLVSDPSGVTPRFVLVPRDTSQVQKRLRVGEPLVAFRLDEIVETDQVLTAGSAHAIVAVSGFLHAQGKPPLLRIASQLVPGDVKDRPLIFLGAFNNPWTLDLSRDLRFAFQVVIDENGWKMAVVDRAKPGRMWVAKTSNHFYEATLDYGLVSRVVSPTGQVVISVAGVTHLGTRAAADFATSDEQWAQVSRRAPADWHKKNIQVMFETKIVNRTPGPPHILETHFW